MDDSHLDGLPDEMRQTILGWRKPAKPTRQIIGYRGLNILIIAAVLAIVALGFVVN